MKTIARRRVGVCIAGLQGAVSTTVLAGVALMKKRLVPRHGMITEGDVAAPLDLAAIEDLVIGGWDLRADDAYTAAVEHAVVPTHLLEEVKEEMAAVRAWPAVVSPQFLSALSGKNVVPAASHREELAILEQDIATFKAENELSSVVMVNLTSTEKFTEVADVHRTIESFEAGLDANDPRISPAMKYAYLAIKLGIPHANFTPSLTKIPALERMSELRGVPIAGEDGKTGQTMLKTALAPAFVVRQLKVDGWFSTNILGNSDGLVLNDPAANKTKVTSKLSVLESVVGYPVPAHQVCIDYYRPRGDAKEAWDNIDLQGFLGENVQIKLNFLCKDSILAAPLVIDLARLLDCAKRHGERGIQRQLSLFFKAPYASEGETPVHDLFKQYQLLEQWIAQVAASGVGARELAG